MPNFLSSIAEKAQSAIDAHRRPPSPDSQSQPTANDAAAQGGHKSHTLGTIQHQLRALGQQYSTTSPVQKIITMEKGVAIDFDSMSRDSKAQSKELYTWGQSESEDIKDVTDRLAYLNFVQGSLASSLAVKLDAARAPLKALRDADTALLPRRNIRSTLQTQLTRLEHDGQKGMEKKIFELKEQIRKAELDDQPQEKEVALLKRKAIRESEQLKWEALREYGEKLVLLSQAATPVIQALPTLPPSSTSPYTGAQVTGAARASLQRALDNYKTGHINLPPHVVGSDLSRSDTRSFGESHANELSSMNTEINTSSFKPNAVPLSPPVSDSHIQPAESADTTTPSKTQSPPLDASHLNLAPATLLSPTSKAPIASPDPTKSNQSIAATPTVAETGVPVVGGPGPSSGSLHDLKAARTESHTESPAYGEGQSGKWESAAEEKKRLQAYSEAYRKPEGQQSHETAEEEKKRLEREERERVLRAQNPGGPPDAKKGDDDLPPYQDL